MAKTRTAKKTAKKPPTRNVQRSVPGMPDVQGSQDARGIAIDRVGVKGVRYPISLLRPEGGVQHTVADVDMYVSLPKEKKGTHMSRFIEVLNEYHEEISSKDVMGIARTICERLHAPEAHLTLEFPYFLDKKAPVTGQRGKLDIRVRFEAIVGDKEEFVMTLRVPATSLCPCSKEISRFGAHNQRCEMEASVKFQKGKFMWIEELASLLESCASTQVFSILKRPDEKFVTEDAYENPKFVEDIVRDLAVALHKEKRIAWFRVSSENFESIHNHNAYAVVESGKR